MRSKSMNIAAGLALLAAALTFALEARAQTPAIEVSTDNDAAEFSAQGDARKVRVEVYAPSGELVFEADQPDAQSIRWGMVNQRGERVADGLYLVTITVVDSNGKRRKRVEQLTVSRERQPSAVALAGAAPSPDAPVTTTVNGTPGRLAKFTGTSTIGNSVVTEGTGGKLGVNVSPVATLHVNGPQPPPAATTGTAAPVLLQTSGGKGGNTTVGGGKVAGAGASISLVAGQGGDAPAGSKRGQGGNILLQPGSTGAGAGTAGPSGNVLIAPSGVGNVGVGTPSPAARLHVKGEMVLDAALPTLHTGAANTELNRYLHLINSPSSRSASGLKAGGVLVADSYDYADPGKNDLVVKGNVGIGTPDPLSLLTVFGSGYGLTHTDGVVTLGTYANAQGGWLGTKSNHPLHFFTNNSQPLMTVTTDGKVGIGKTDPTAMLHVLASNSVIGVSVGSGIYHAIEAYNSSSPGSGFGGSAIYAESLNTGVAGRSRDGQGLLGLTETGVAVAGLVQFNGSGLAGRFDGPVLVNGTFSNSSDRDKKANISDVDPRSILRKLVGVPVQAWNYKAEPASVRHLGPMAQDFRAAFQLGTDDKSISTVDSAGVAFASIQALYQLMLEKDRQIEVLTRKVEQQQAQLTRQQAQLDRVGRVVRRRR